jgi:SNF family Na+-dependent transporter
MAAFAIDTSIAEELRAAWGDKRRQSRKQLTAIVLIVIIILGAAILSAAAPRCPALILGAAIMFSARMLFERLAG